VSLVDVTSCAVSAGGEWWSLRREGAAAALSKMLHHRLQAQRHPFVSEAAQQAQAFVRDLMARLQQLSDLDPDSAQLPLRGLVERLAQLTIYTLLLEQADAELSRGHAGTGQRKWLVAQLFLRRHIRAHPDGWAADDDTTALRYFDALVDWKPVIVDAPGY